MINVFPVKVGPALSIREIYNQVDSQRGKRHINGARIANSLLKNMIPYL
jgi:hypothetical protein